MRNSIARDVLTDVQNVLDRLAAGGIDFELFVTTSSNEWKSPKRGVATSAHKHRQVSATFGFQLGLDTEDGLLPIEDRVRFFIKKVAAPQISVLIDRNYDVRITPSNAVQGGAVKATRKNVEELLQFAAQRALLMAISSGLKSSVNLAVLDNEQP